MLALYKSLKSTFPKVFSNSFNKVTISATYCLTSLNCLISLSPKIVFFFIIKRLDIIYFSERLWALKIMCLLHNGHVIIGTVALYTHNFTLTLSRIKRSSQPINFKYHLDWAFCGIDLLPLTTYVFNSKVRQLSPSVNNMHPHIQILVQNAYVCALKNMYPPQISLVWHNIWGLQGWFIIVWQHHFFEAGYTGGRLRGKTEPFDSIITHTTFNVIVYVSKILYQNLKR